MGIEQKVESAKKALRTMKRLGIFSYECNELISDTSDSLFAKITQENNFSEEQKENEIDKATVGILVVALSYYLSKYDYLKNLKYDLSDLCSCDENGIKYSAYYSMNYETLLDKCGISKCTAQDRIGLLEYRENLVLAVGTKVLNRELPFQTEILNAIVEPKFKDLEFINSQKSFDKIGKEERQLRLENIIFFKEYIRAIATKIQTSDEPSKTEDPEQIFENALEILSPSTTSTTRLLGKFKEGIKALKKATLTSFKENDQNFKFDDYKKIATNALVLSEKVAANNVSQADVNEFTLATQQYKKSHKIAIALTLMIGAVISMTVGAVAGFELGNVTGAIIGGAFGLVAGGVLSGVASTMWHSKKEPLNQVSSAATNMIFL